MVQADSISFKGRLCFRDHWVGLASIKPINVIIGRNNTGKSQLLDLIGLICGSQIPPQNWSVRCSGVLSEETLRPHFPENTSQGVLGGNHWRDHGLKLVGTGASWEFGSDGDVSDFQLEQEPYAITARSAGARRQILYQLARDTRHPLSRTSFRRLAADRDITTEADTAELSLAPNGEGASNLIRRFLLSASDTLPREVIQGQLLTALNQIFAQDGDFSEIHVNIHDEEHTHGPLGEWEVYLGEESKGLVPLSRSGSGLKTLILALLNLLAVPVIDGRPKSEYTFAFEELENNLHPALLRRLLLYLERFALENRCTIFLTTHSSTTLDVFGMSSNAQIIHLSHDGASAKATTVAAHFDQLNVISEIGAKPSDLLQANGVVWVEGPSDRVYINRWIELISEGELHEGRDYQCAYFGGTLLARVQFKAPEDEEDTSLANLLRVNPNVIVVCDGDRRAKGAHIKGRVKRIRDEVRTIPRAYIWITAAKEIENYIPGPVLRRALGLSSLPDPLQYENFFPRRGARHRAYLSAHTSRASLEKMKLALDSVRYMDLDTMSSRFDWQAELRKIVKRIKEWNE